MNSPSVLLIDDENDFTKNISELLRLRGDESSCFKRIGTDQNAGRPELRCRCS